MVLVAMQTWGAMDHKARDWPIFVIVMFELVCIAAALALIPLCLALSSQPDLPRTARTEGCLKWLRETKGRHGAFKGFKTHLVTTGESMPACYLVVANRLFISTPSH